MQTAAHPLRIYWVTWGILLVLTLTMLVMDGANLPRGPFVALMLAAMGIKATLIGANFMHLRTERAGIVATVVIGLLFCGLLLYVLIVPDALRIHEMVARGGRP